MYISMNQSPSHNFGTPAPNWATGHQTRKDSTMWVPAMLIGALIFAVGCGSGLVVGWFSGASTGLFDLFENLEAEIAVETALPDTVQLGDSFELVITITDTSGNARTIEDIDFSGSLPDNAEFVSITPSPNQVNPDSGYIEHVFHQSLGANQSMDFIFEIKPTQSGVYNADISVYMDGYNSEYTEVTIEVLTD